MKFLILSLIITSLSSLASSTPLGLQNRDRSCTVLANGFELVDDTPAINKAIGECGTGGTIFLPSDQIYSIRTPLNLTSCAGCDIQLEGTLLLSNDYLYWSNSSGPVIPISNVHGLKLRSLTGKGIIDGNSGTWHQRGRGDQYGTLTGGVIAYISGLSSNITISGLTIKNALATFFKQNGGNDIHYSNLNLSVSDAIYLPVYNRVENIGFEIGNTTNTTFRDIHVDFHTSGGYRAGGCIGIDYDTTTTTIENVYCKTIDGILIEFDQFLYSNHTVGRQNTASKLLVSNYTASTDAATGFRNAYYSNASINGIFNDLTWQGVTVLDGKPVGYDFCYDHYNTQSGHCDYASAHLNVTYNNVSFKGFKWGNGTAIPDVHLG